MSLKQFGQLCLVAAVATWIVMETLVQSWNTGVDPITTGSINPGTPARRQTPPPMVIAQTMPDSVTPPAGQPAEPVAARQSVAGQPDGKVDESALRYFARQGDTRRLEAEIARLKAIYPAWQPPQDPSAPEDYSDPELDRK